MGVSAAKSTIPLKRWFVAAAAALALFAASGCSDPLPIPRIEPRLHHWPRPYEGVDGLTVHVFNTGLMRSPRGAVYAGGSWGENAELDMLAFVVEHPDGAVVVFDTGLSQRVRTDMADYLGWIYTQLDMVETDMGQDLPSQMLAAGLDPESVDTVVLSHMHYDHTGTVEAFPHASVVVSSRERSAAGRDPLTRGFFVRDDTDEVSDWVEIDYDLGEPYATFIAHEDLLGDGSVVAVDLRGHTPGSQGLVVRTPGAPILLTGDAAWVDESWRYAARPIWADDMRMWWEQIWRIKKFSQLEPRLLVIPGHDGGPARRAELEALVYHPFEMQRDGEESHGGA